MHSALDIIYFNSVFAGSSKYIYSEKTRKYY